MIYYCAYNFPAVLLCYGSETWPVLKSVYLNMANERDKKVKTSIASSIAEVAQLLDNSIVEKDILPIFDRFYKDDSNLI
jgi:serine/threonine-protein phosphatase 4 regulatory subunit 1